MNSYDKYIKNLNPKPELKGKRNGNCNRTSCQQPHAVYYNPYTYAYYCEKCVNILHDVWDGQAIMTKRCHVPLDLIEELWLALGKVSMVDERLDGAFLSFEAGTHRDEVWHWFDGALAYHQKMLGDWMLSKA